MTRLTTHLGNFAAEAPSSWEPMFARARMLEAAGFDRVVASDHVVFGERLHEYGRPELGGQRGGIQPTGPDGHWLEPLMTLAVLAGMTSTIRLGTAVILAALRRPLTLAKTAATLDVLSQGRLDLGVGVGWQREEYHAAGLSFEDRGRSLDHTLDVCKTLWRRERAAYASGTLRFTAIHMMPKPAQRGGVPIWVSGTVNPRVVSRLGRFGVGWIPWGPDRADVCAGIARMTTALADAGHDPAGLLVEGHVALVYDGRGAIDAMRTMEVVPRLIEAGVTEVNLSLPRWDDPSLTIDALRALTVAFRAAAGRDDLIP